MDADGDSVVVTVEERESVDDIVVRADEVIEAVVFAVRVGAAETVASGVDTLVPVAAAVETEVCEPQLLALGAALSLG